MINKWWFIAVFTLANAISFGITVDDMAWNIILVAVNSFATVMCIRQGVLQIASRIILEINTSVAVLINHRGAGSRLREAMGNHVTQITLDTETAKKAV